MKKIKEKRYNKKALEILTNFEKNENFGLILNKIYLTSENIILKVQSLICLKNYTKKLFLRRSKIKIENKKKEEIEIIKKQIIENIILSLKNEKEKKFRNLINSIFIQIVKSKHYVSYFFNYSESVISEFEKMENLNLFFYQKIKSIVLALQEITKNRLSIKMSQFVEFRKIFILRIYNIFKFLTSKYSENFNNELIIRFNIIIDKLIIYLISAGNSNTNYFENLMEISKNLVFKMKDIFSFLKKIEDKEILIDEKIYELLNKNAIVLTFDLKNIIDVSPLIFSNFIQDFFFLILNVFKIKWKSEILRKSVALVFQKILKTYLYYTNPNFTMSKLICEKLKFKIELQKKCFKSFFEVFNKEEELKNIIDFIITDLMIYDFNEIDLEIFIEDQENDNFECINSEFEISIQKLGSLIFKELLFRFSDNVLKIYYEILNKILKEEIILSEIIIDNIFCLVAYLPGIYLILNIDSENQINFFTILEFLNKKKEKEIFLRRFLILYKKLKVDYNKEDKIKLTNIFLNCLKMEDEIIQYESLDCLKKIIKEDINLELNYLILIENTTPTIINLLKKFKISSLIIKMSNYLTILLKRIQNLKNEQISKAFQNFDISLIIEKNPKLMKPMIADILKSLLMTDKSSLLVVNLSLEYLKVCILNYEEENIISLVKFWSFFVKSTENEGILEGGGIFFENFILFFENFFLFEKINDEDVIGYCLDILEESIFFECLDFFRFENYLKKIYNYAGILESEATANFLKIKVISFYSTFFLFNLEKKTLNLNNFEFCFEILIKEIMFNKSMSSEKILTLKNSILILFNRFLINYSENIIKIIFESEYTIENFIENYLFFMEFLTLKESKRINSFAILIFLKFIPENLLIKYFEKFMIKIISEVIYSITHEDKIKNYSLNKNQFYSERKLKLEFKYLYEEINLKNFFKENIKVN